MATEADSSARSAGGTFVELGATGLQRFSGTVNEEFLTELRGDRARKVYRQMLDNDPIVGALSFAIDRLVRQVVWRVEPGGDDGAAQFIEDALDDMSSTWDDTLSEILSSLWYGWSYHEIVYKRRQGPGSSGSTRSRFTDNRIGWRKIPIRAQDTLDEWEFDDAGGVLGMYQRAAPTYERVFIPIQKALLFRPSTHKGNPEGRSLLRNGYRPYFFKRNMENIEAIGLERDLAGLPIMYVPEQLLSSTATNDEKALREELLKILKNIRRDEQEGVMLPMKFDRNTGTQLIKLELLSTGGRRQFDTNAVIGRYNAQILMTVLADFILLGHQEVGSYALGETKSRLFTTSLNTILESIAAIMNRYAIPRLLALNGMPVDDPPTLEHRRLDEVTLDDVLQFVTALNPDVDLELENAIRERLNLPTVERVTIKPRASPSEPPDAGSSSGDTDPPAPPAGVEGEPDDGSDTGTA